MFAGGVALFLLGMKLLTDGLKLAAGESLRNLLAKWTSGMVKGILSGVLITAMVQSSSAVIFATIGFVNAGVMTLTQAIYVIFGSNVGTTLTGWIIAGVGLRINLQAFAMPLLAIGMALWLSGGGARKTAWGQALAGFSLFFLGIDILKGTFSDLGEIIPFDALGTGFSTALLMVAAGIVLTTAMQSSSATIAVVLTAAAGGIIPLDLAAYMVIGADIGTTSTALFAVYGATANARRTAMSHVIFNLVSGLFMLALVPIYLKFILSVFGPELGVATVIAIFHTMKKLTGLALLLPFTSRLESFLMKQFTSTELRPGITRYLDDIVIETPSLGVSALIFELKRVGRKTRRMVANGIQGEPPKPGLTFEEQQRELIRLHVTVGTYIQKMQQKESPDDLRHVLTDAMRVLGYFRESSDMITEILRLSKSLDELNPALREKVEELHQQVLEICQKADSEHPHFDVQVVDDINRQFALTYESAKLSLLNSGTRGKLRMESMLQWHDYIRGLRRITDQLSKAARYMDAFNRLIDHTPGEGPALMEAAHQ